MRVCSTASSKGLFKKLRRADIHERSAATSPLSSPTTRRSCGRRSTRGSRSARSSARAPSQGLSALDTAIAQALGLDAEMWQVRKPGHAPPKDTAAPQSIAERRLLALGERRRHSPSATTHRFEGRIPPAPIGPDQSQRARPDVARADRAEAGDIIREELASKATRSIMPSASNWSATCSTSCSGSGRSSRCSRIRRSPTYW